MILAGAEPFFMPGGKRGVLLVHGFTGLPAELLLMGRDLNARGYSVLGVRLAGHATRAEDLACTTGEDWLDSVRDGYALLSVRPHRRLRPFDGGLARAFARSRETRHERHLDGGADLHRGGAAHREAAAARGVHRTLCAEGEAETERRAGGGKPNVSAHAARLRARNARRIGAREGGSPCRDRPRAHPAWDP